MRFLNPTLLWIGLGLALIPILLYIFRPRPKTVRTSTLVFFKWLAKEHQDSGWLKFLKYLISLLLTLCVIGLAASAWGKLVAAPSEESVKTVVILIDRSASMAATDSDEQSRLDAALTEIRRRVAGLSSTVGVVVIAYDVRPEVLLSRSLDRREIQRVLGEIEVRPVESRLEPAQKLAVELAQLETPAVIWHATDTPTETTDDKSAHHEAAADVTIEPLAVTLTEPVNVGITAVQVRRLPLQQTRFNAFVQIRATGPKTISTELEVHQDNTLVELRKLKLSPGETETLLIPIDADSEADKIVTLTVKTKGDVLSLDDTVHVHVPRIDSTRVLWITAEPNPFTELVLTTLGDENHIQILQGAPEAWPPKDPVDLVIFDGWLPESWTRDAAAIVINPPAGIGPIRAERIGGNGVPIDRLRAADESHPLLYGVATGRIAVMQTAVLEVDGPLNPLWVGSQGPVLLAGEIEGQRIVVMGFDPAISEVLQLTISYPMLIGNAILWTVENRLALARGLNVQTGDLVELKGKTLTWSGTAEDEPIKQPIESRWTEMNRIGIWKTDAGETGSAALLSSNETVLPSRDEKSDSSSEASADAPSWRRSSWWAELLQGDLVPLLMWSAVFLLLLESVLYHRYLIY